jgi:prepilin-type N-terminal cleavage/methylation domain-containing protein
MNRAKYWRDQSGYTLIEVVITSALTLVVMSALTSVVLTSVRAANTATGRVEASSQIRNFEYRAYDDFAHSGVPAASCSVSVPCSTAPLVLSGPQWHSSPPSASNYQVTYTWDGASFLDRQVAGDASIHLLANAKAFSWYLDDTPPKQTVVVNLTVVVLGYSESQTFRFYPRLNP